MPHPGLKVATNPYFDGRLRGEETGFDPGLAVKAEAHLAGFVCALQTSTGILSQGWPSWFLSFWLRSNWWKKKLEEIK